MLRDVYSSGKRAEQVDKEAAVERLASYKLKTVLKHLEMSTFEYDIAEDAMYVSKEAMLLTGFTDYWFEDRGDYYYLDRVSERLHDVIRSSFYDVAAQELDKVRTNVSREILSFDAPIVYSQGNSKWANFIMDTMLDEDGKPSYAIGYCKDVHQQKKELYRLRKVAQTDALTGFRKKIAADFMIEQRFVEEKDEMHFLAVLDLNNFKRANDLFGHSFGDLLLKNVSDRIRKIEDHYTICSRTGGDEFMFFRKCSDLDDALRILTELRDSINHSVSYQKIDFDVTAAIGFSIYPTQGDTLEDLYNKADIAMYYAKNNKISDPTMYNDTMESIRR